MTVREQFIAVVGNDPLLKADAIIVLEGDGFNRLPRAKELYEQGWAPTVVISGGVDNKAGGSFPARLMAEELIKQGVPRESVVTEESSVHTRGQALEIMKLAKRGKWKGMLLVASQYHQYRAYLTFLRAMREARLRLRIISAPARELSWFEAQPWGSRLELLEDEFNKIRRYSRLGHLATLEEALSYQKWKEGTGRRSAWK